MNYYNIILQEKTFKSKYYYKKNANAIRFADLCGYALAVSIITGQVLSTTHVYRMLHLVADYFNSSLHIIFNFWELKLIITMQYIHYILYN
jgi:hypothetical protein